MGAMIVVNYNWSLYSFFVYMFVCIVNDQQIKNKAYKTDKGILSFEIP